MRVLVTGASGFIGRAVAARLSGGGHEVVGFDRHPKEVPGVARMIRGDIQDAEAVEDAVRGTDGVINLAGLLGTSELLSMILPAIEANIIGASEMMLACIAHKKPLVQISPGNKTWLSVYPITKMCAERLALALGADAGLKVAVVRAMNVYGPWQKHAPVRKYIPNLVRWAMLGQPAEIYGDGEQVMDPIWVGDTAEVLSRALQWAADGGKPQVFEAGCGLHLNANYVADRVWSTVVERYEAMPKVHAPMRPGEPERSVTVADTRTLRLLGLEPDRDFLKFREGIARTVEWYRAHPNVLGLDGTTIP